MAPGARPRSAARRRRVAAFLAFACRPPALAAAGRAALGRPAAALPGPRRVLPARVLRAQPNAPVADVVRERGFRPDAQVVACSDPSRAQRDLLFDARVVVTRRAATSGAWPRRARRSCSCWPGGARVPGPPGLPRGRDHRYLPATALTLGGLVAGTPAAVILAANYGTADPVAEARSASAMLSRSSAAARANAGDRRASRRPEQLGARSERGHGTPASAARREDHERLCRARSQKASHADGLLQPVSSPHVPLRRKLEPSSLRLGFRRPKLHAELRLRPQLAERVPRGGHRVVDVARRCGPGRRRPPRTARAAGRRRARAWRGRSARSRPVSDGLRARVVGDRPRREEDGQHRAHAVDAWPGRPAGRRRPPAGRPCRRAESGLQPLVGAGRAQDVERRAARGHRQRVAGERARLVDRPDGRDVRP